MSQEETTSTIGSVEKEHKAGITDHNNNNNDNNAEVCCPVCLREDVSFVHGPCHHKICLPCAERILAAPIRQPLLYNNDHNDDDDASPLPAEDAHLDVPTRGRCPLCRSEICLFGLEKENDDDDDDDDDQHQSTKQLFYPAVEKNHSIVQALKGRVYVRNRSQIGNQSLHFPSDTTTTNTVVEEETQDENLLPYMDFSKVKNLSFDNRDPLPDRKYFEPDFHFHEPTRTFHGRLLWGETCCQRVNGSQEWELVVAFSSDFEYISRGVLVKKRNTCQDPSCSRLYCKFPLDGRWRISWPDQINSSSGRESKTFIVHNNKGIEQSSLINGDIERIWALAFGGVIMCQSVGSIFESQFNLTERNIQVGESLEFTATMLDDRELGSRIIWTRETSDPEREHLAVLNFGSGPSQLHYHSLSDDATNGNAVPEYHSDSVWGNTFCQGYTVGLASYHFMETMEDGAYISYEHEGTSVWPPLDNGNPIPARIWFTEISFDPEHRIFRGKIDWERAHQTTWQGSRWWRYEMQFDEYYSCITGGYVNSVQPGSDREMDMSKFGIELLYINAGLVEHCWSSDDFDVLQRSIENLVIQGRREMDANDSPHTRSLNLFRVLYQTTVGENSNIRYPRSFRRSEEVHGDTQEQDDNHDSEDED